MKRFLCLMLFVGCIFCACSNKTETVQQSTLKATEIAIEVVATESTLSGTERVTESVEDTIDKNSVLAYDEYFSEIKAKDTMRVPGYGLMFVDPRNTLGDIDVFAVTENLLNSDPSLPEGSIGKIVLYQSGEYTILSEIKIKERVLSYNEESVLVVTEDGHTLLQIPFDGSEPIVIYEDPYDKMGQAEYFDKCVFFTAGTGENTVGIYRLYIPENRIDVLVADIQIGVENGDALTVGFSVVSNCEISWTVAQPILSLYGEQLWDESIIESQESDRTPREYFEEQGINDYNELIQNKSYSDQYVTLIDHWLFNAQNTYSKELFYLNCLSGEFEKAFGFQGQYNSNTVVYSDGTMRDEEETQTNGELWWIDTFYISNS